MSFALPQRGRAEFQVNTYTTGGQAATSARAVARAADGSFVVVWDSGGDGSGYGVQGQRFDSSGAAVGTEFRVNSYTTSHQFAAAVSATADGSFVVVWESIDQNSDGYSVHGQRFDSTGVAAGTEFQVNTYTTSRRTNPQSVAMATDGSFVVVWQNGQDGFYEVRGQRFDSAGAAVGTEFQVNSFTTDDQSQAAVSAAADGSFVVVWMSDGQDGFAESIQGQRFDSSGATAGTEFQVNTYTTSRQTYPAVSAAGDGSFVVVWMSDGQDGFGWSVEGQRFDSTGTPTGTEFQVNSYTTEDQGGPAVAAAADGSFVVVWSSEGPDCRGYGIQGQRFDSAGAAAGTEFQVNTYTPYFQVSSSLAVDAAGDFVIVWTSYPGQDGSSFGVFGQLSQDTSPNIMCTSCGSTPASGCLGGAKASFQLRDSSDAGDQIKWKLQKGDAFDQDILGYPWDRAYSLCIYDETAGMPLLVASLTINPSFHWDGTPKGYNYKDKAGLEDGVIKASFKAGAAGETSMSVLAKGIPIPMPAPFSATEFFDVDDSVTVQLVNDETLKCWTSEFTAAKKNIAERFKASAP